MSAVGKRKRDEYEASDDEDGHVLGKQVLPVADLPFNFDGVPEDGAQYLFTVRYVLILRLGQHIVLAVLIGCMPCRRDASLLPHITRVDNPYAIPEAPANVAPDPSTSHTSRKPAVPSKEWRGVVEKRFRNLKRVRVPCAKSLKDPPIHSSIRTWTNLRSTFKSLFPQTRSLK